MNLMIYIKIFLLFCSIINVEENFQNIKKNYNKTKVK